MTEIEKLTAQVEEFRSQWEAAEEILKDIMEKFPEVADYIAENWEN